MIQRTLGFEATVCIAAGLLRPMPDGRVIQISAGNPNDLNND
jgi:hypothetical protein